MQKLCVVLNEFFKWLKKVQFFLAPLIQIKQDYMKSLDAVGDNTRWTFDSFLFFFKRRDKVAFCYFETRKEEMISTLKNRVERSFPFHINFSLSRRVSRAIEL